MKGSSKSDMNAVIEDPKSPQSQLTMQQQKFVDLYCSAEDLSQTEAARRAGYKYPALSGHQLLRKPHVVACIDEKRREIGHKYRITPERKARDLINIQHKAQEEGKYIAALKAIELQVKLAGLDIKKSINITGKIDIDSMTEEDIKKELMNLAKEAERNTVDLPPESFVEVIEPEESD